MRVTVLSRAYAVEINRGKFHWLNKEQGTDLRLVVPSQSRQAELKHEFSPRPIPSGRIQVYPLPLRGGHRPALQFYPYWALRGCMRSFHPDLVHVEEEPWTLTAFQAALVARECRLPLTLFTWENLNRRLPPPFGAVNRFVLAQAAHLVAGSAAAEQVARIRGYRGPITRSPQLGVDLGVFRPAERAPVPGDDGPVTVGFAGRISVEKGVEVLIEAIGQLPDRYRLVLIGDGPLAASIGGGTIRGCAPSRITLVGSVGHAEVARHMQELDILVLPSLSTPNWVEQFGHVLIEGMACGLALVGSSSGAIPEVIGTSGMIVTEGDSGCLAEALHRLGDPAARAELGARARRRVEVRFSDQVVARRLNAVFEQVVQQRQEAA